MNNENKNPKKRIFLISNMWPDADSPGFGSFVKNVADGLSCNGYSIVRKALIVGRPRNSKGKLKSYFSFYWRIAKGFIAGGYDMIYIHFPNQAVPLLNALYHLKHPKIVVNYHGEDLLYEKGGYKEKLGKRTDRFITRYVDRVVVPSPYFRDMVVSRGLISSDRVIVSPSGGLSEDVFYPKPAEDIPEMFTSDRRLRIGFVGRLEEEKGIMEFLKAFDVLKSKGIPVEASIVGYGGLEREVEDFIDKHGLHDNINFIHGMAQKELGDYYRALDLFVFPSMAYESLGLTGLEALACGIPVVGSDIGGIATYLIESGNGLLVAPGDVMQLAGRIEEFSLMAPSRRSEMRNQAIKTGRGFYSKEVCDALSLRFDELLDERGQD